MKKLAILGSTGSIGTNSLLIIQNNPKSFKVVALSADKNVKKMVQQCEIFTPQWASLRNREAAKELKIQLKSRNIKTKVLSGDQAVCELVSLESVDYIILAISGSSGLIPILHAIQSKKIILLANKESLIIGNHLLMKEVKANNTILIPIDSEHNAMFQSFPLNIQKKMHSANLRELGIKSIVLTGSGGPLLKIPLHKFKNITPCQACAHPNWIMGKKISVDSATMMNKGLEYIETHLLFNTHDIDIELVIHPESVIHSMIRYYNGSIIANLSINDIRISIFYALFWPNNAVSNLPHLDFFKLKKLSFENLNLKKYPCLSLALNAFHSGHAAIIILNAANEIAVFEFLRLKIKFTDIYKVIESVLSILSCSNPIMLEEILEIDKLARIKTKEVISKITK
ncbi:MAG: 1-deoxy-D-xylulose-5-phosphate reductoisomerase [Buchnera aphidicola (Nurudea yanoniella)]